MTRERSVWKPNRIRSAQNPPPHQPQRLALERLVLNTVDKWIYDTVTEGGVDGEDVEWSGELHVAAAEIDEHINGVGDPAEHEAHSDGEQGAEHVPSRSRHLVPGFRRFVRRRSGGRGLVLNRRKLLRIIGCKTQQFNMTSYSYARRCSCVKFEDLSHQSLRSRVNRSQTEPFWFVNKTNGHLPLLPADP